MLQLPSANRRIRLLVMGYGLLLFLWFTPEDNQVWPVVLLGWGLAGLLVGVNVMNRLGGKWIPGRYLLPGAVVLGGLTGLGASVATAGLMFFKNALHAHLFVDFPTPMLLTMLERAPAWGLAGALAGLGVALAWLAIAPTTLHHQ